MKTTFQYDHYYTYPELTEALQTLVKNHPDLLAMESICKSEKGRDVWALTLTQKQTGDPLAKPAFYIDANTHAGEVTGSMAALHTLDVLCTNYGEDAQLTRLADTLTFYVIPRISVDGSEVYLTSPYDLRSADRPYLTPVQQPGLVPEDMDQDGVIRMMRIKDKHGAWKISKAHPQLMEKRKPDEREGEFYTVVSEGVLKGANGNEIQPAPTLWGLDFNRNYPFGWFHESRQAGAGAYPLSNPENKAVVDFVLAHHNIGAVATHHTSGGVILYPPGTRPEKSADPDDMRRLREIAAMATEEMGYPAINIFDHFMTDQENYSSGAFDDWCFQDQGIPAYTLELWNLLERAGCKIDWDRRDAKSEAECLDTMAKVLAWCAENAPESMEAWTPYQHPQLGLVEIGGLNLKFTEENCPNAFLLQEVEKTTKFCLRYAQSLPQLEIDKTNVNWLGADLAEVTVTISNVGYLPTYLSREAKLLGTARPVKVSLQGQIESFIAGHAIMEIGDLEGYSGVNAEYRSCEVTTGAHAPLTHTLRWLVQARKGAEITITAFQPKAGRAVVKLVL